MKLTDLISRLQNFLNICVLTYGHQKRNQKGTKHKIFLQYRLKNKLYLSFIKA